MKIMQIMTMPIFARKGRRAPSLSYMRTNFAFSNFHHQPLLLPHVVFSTGNTVSLCVSSIRAIDRLQRLFAVASASFLFGSVW